MAEYAFGIDIGGTTVKIGFFDIKGELLKKWEIPTRKEEGGSLILPDIAEAIKEELAERKAQFRWQFPAEKYPRFLRLFVKNVGSMAKGGIWE